MGILVHISSSRIDSLLESKRSDMDDLNMISFGIIADAGDSKHYSMEALANAERHDFSNVDNLLRQSRNALEKARRAQTDLLFAEMNGQAQKVSVLLVHSQDHLMNAELALDLIEKMIKTLRNQAELEQRVAYLERILESNS